MKHLLTALMLAFACNLNAQHAMTWNEFTDFVSTDENAESEEWAEHLDELYELHQHPIDINSASLDDLMQIPVLTQTQAEDIRLYVLRYGAMKTTGELLAITSIDFDLRRILPLFVYAAPPQDKGQKSLKFKDGRHDILTRIDMPLYRRQGELDGSYSGSGLAHRLRYNYELGKNIQAGFGFKKDACEPMTFSAGYDHWSGFALLRNMKWLRTAVVGDYRMGWGSGLLVNNRFFRGKSAFSVSTASGVAGHRSATESDFFRGGAATLGCDRLQFTAFFSCRLLDANYDAEGHATSLYLSGLHRTHSEMAKRHVQRQLMLGAHASWHASRVLELGATAFGERYSMPFTRGDDIYKRFYPEGTDFGGASLDYSLRLGRFSLTGETATNGSGLATLNSFTWRQSRKLSATLSQRYYSKGFYSFHSRAFCESDVQNEHGYYLSLQAEPWTDFTLRAYADFFFRPYPIYKVNHSSSGIDLRLQASYRLNAHHQLEARAQWKHKEVYYALYVSQKYSLFHTYQSGPWKLRTQVQMHHYSTAAPSRDIGVSLQPTLHYQHRSWRASLSAAWFKTDDYYSRVYLSQPSLNGIIPVLCYGHGITSAATVRYAFSQRLVATLRYSLAAYFDRTTISSGHQAIPHSSRHDISLQMQLKIK